jgi:hypothetical protein
MCQSVPILVNIVGVLARNNWTKSEILIVGNGWRHWHFQAVTVHAESLPARLPRHVSPPILFAIEHHHKASKYHRANRG